MSEYQVSALRRFGEAPVFVFCDHATNAMPAEFDGLRLPEDVLATHIAWDIGAAALAEAIARALSGTLLTCGFSRLIIDPNRAPDTTDSIRVTSDCIPVPGNHDLDEKERARRRAMLFDPYHEALEAALDEMIQRSGPPFILSVHSFTKRLISEQRDRPWPIGVLWRSDEESARSLIARLKARTGWLIGDNEPYNARLFNYSVDRHAGARGFRHATIEVRQDLVESQEGVRDMTGVLAPALAELAGLSAKRKGVA